MVPMVANKHYRCKHLATFARSRVHIIHENSSPSTAMAKSACILYTSEYYMQDFTVLVMFADFTADHLWVDLNDVGLWSVEKGGRWMAAQGQESRWRATNCCSPERRGSRVYFCYLILLLICDTIHNRMTSQESYKNPYYDNVFQDNVV